MKILVALAVCFVSAVYAGFSGGSTEGWMQQESSGWEQQMHSRPQQDQQKIIIIKQDQGAQRAGGSLTIAGPTHTIKTIHQVRTLDQGGKILSKMGSSGGQAKILIVKDVKTAQVQHATPQMHGGWPQHMMQMQGGW